jgi:hypothetical protein
MNTDKKTIQSIDTYFLQPKCCLDQFLYPSSITPRPPRVGVGSTGIWQVAFRFNAYFNPHPPPCDCTCCEFRQIFIKSAVTKFIPLIGPDKPESPVQGPFEDCVWYYECYDRNHQNKRVAKVSGGPEQPPPPPPDCYGATADANPVLAQPKPFCYGHRVMGEVGPDPGDPGHTGFEGGACLFEDNDNPFVAIKGPGFFKWEWEAEGQIVDACHFDFPKATRRVRWTIYGYIHSDGHTTDYDFSDMSPPAPWEQK